MLSKRRLVILFWLHKYALISVVSIIILQQLIILTIDYRAIPHECCSYVKIIFYLCFVKRLTDILESVFALSFKENVAIFNSKRQRTALILVWIMADALLASNTPYPSSVGYCIVYFAMGLPQPSLR